MSSIEPVALAGPLSEYSRFHQRLRRRYAQELALLPPGVPTRDVLGATCDALLAAGHDLGAALRHADRVIVLRQGQLLADGAPAQAITPALLARVYGVQARVEPCSQGLPQVIVDGLTAAA
jgi:hypothetical protein